MKNEKLRTLVTCALLLAVSAVLSVYPKFKFLLNGGSITFCSMLPIIVASYVFGVKTGLLTGFAFSLIQLITGFSGSGLGPVAFVVELLFDYVIAFTVLGLGGIFRNLKSTRSGLAAGAFIATLLRFISHLISGIVVWGEYAEWFFGNLSSFGESILSKYSGGMLTFLYSFIYNGSYMIPEIIITTAAAALIAPLVKKLMDEEEQS
ncbi:MAG: energy-coupled thiamine transporter ThiT [Oscillospiraceae bacterium]|nr:energy-coupled thiamine transporter ThiT [Oscillospiraceae bacterium]